MNGPKRRRRTDLNGLISTRFQNLGDLRAKESSAAGGWVADAVRIHAKFLQLTGGDFSQRDNSIARK